MPPPPVPLRQPHTPHQTGTNVPGMPTGRAAKRRSPDDPEENADKDGSPSGRKKPRMGGAPQTPGAQNGNVNGTPTAVTSSATMAPPLMLQQGQQGPPSGVQQPSQPQQTQTPQGQPPSTPQIPNRFMPGPAGMVGSVGPGQQRPGTAGGPLGTMPSLGYPNSGGMNGIKVSMAGAPGTPGLGAGGVGPGGMSMIQTGPIGSQVGRSLSSFFCSGAVR
jgi:translation initiation factor IF-2